MSRPLPALCPDYGKHDWRTGSGCGVCGWDGQHDTSTVRSGQSEHGRCSCGWRGPARRGARAGWEASADADEHVNGVG